MEYAIKRSGYVNSINVEFLIGLRGTGKTSTMLMNAIERLALNPNLGKIVANFHIDINFISKLIGRKVVFDYNPFFISDDEERDFSNSILLIDDIKKLKNVEGIFIFLVGSSRKTNTSIGFTGQSFTHVIKENRTNCDYLIYPTIINQDDENVYYECFVYYEIESGKVFIENMYYSISWEIIKTAYNTFETVLESTAYNINQQLDLRFKNDMELKENWIKRFCKTTKTVKNELLKMIKD